MQFMVLTPYRESHLQLSTIRTIIAHSLLSRMVLALVLQTSLSQDESFLSQTFQLRFDFVFLKGNFVRLFRLWPKIWRREATVKVRSIVVHYGNWEHDIHAKLLEIRSCLLRKGDSLP